MTEKEFAKILGTSEVNLRNIKYVGIKTKVLKEDTGITEEKKEEIRAELKGQGYERKSINYQEFLEIYEPYRKEMTERKFAEILGISSLGNIKYGGMRAKILKEKVEKEEKIKEERKEEIREELKEQGYERKSIDYQEFLEIYELYRKELTRQEPH